MTKTTQRTLAVAASAVILSAFIWGTSRWLAAYDSISAAVADSCRTIASDWMLVVMLTDAFLLFLMIFVWLAADARSRGWLGVKRWAWIAAVMSLGCPALLLYLAFRPEKLSRVSRGRP
jgi:drug/metabolite transporter (DMT)-like permease